MESGATRRPGWLKAFKWLTLATATLVIAQAVLIGRALFGDIDLVDVHGVVANFVWLSAIAQVIMLIALKVGSELSRRLMMLSVVFAILMTIQIGLGYAAADTDEAGALHVPLGVLLFGFSVLIAMLAAQLERESIAAS